MTLLEKNRVTIAAAGSLKTTNLVKLALSKPDKRILITTYTNENLYHIENSIMQICGHIPGNIQTQTWFSFLLMDGVRPYQRIMNQTARVESINFNDERVRYRNRQQLNYYVDSANRLYRDVVADFACECNAKTNGAVINRLEGIYDLILIDEAQDLSGYDLDFLTLLFFSKIEMMLVGDPRQSIYSTCRSQKNSQYRGSAIVNWFEKMHKEKKISIDGQNQCFRCNPEICQFADTLYPELPSVESKNYDRTGHDGIFLLHPRYLTSYISSFQPVLLRHDKRTPTHGYLNAINFGLSKGQTFNRVLIFPTQPIRDFLDKGTSATLPDVSKAKLYVAVTRARYSVGFISEKAAGSWSFWQP